MLDAASEFVTTKAAREPKTVAAYRGVLLGSDRGTKKPLGLPLAAYFQNRRVSSLTPVEIATWFNQRVQNGAQDTKHRISKNSRAFLRWAREQGYTDADLAGAIDVYHQGGPRVDWLEWTQVHELLDAIPERRLRFAATWLFLTGCRVGEAIKARQRDVRLRTGIGLYEWTLTETKTHAPRSVWLPDYLAGELDRTRADNKPEPGYQVLWDSEGRGFGRIENPAYPISERTINSSLDRARREVGLTVAVTAHVARHSYCTSWVTEQGSDERALEKLSRQVGTSVGVLRRTYIHLRLDETDWASLRGFDSPS